jgi:class 3 adenylate cyclase
MFADLRGFTRFVENNRPEDVMASLRGYFTAMHKSIRRHRGLVLQFVGDEIEAVFGVPVPFGNHADAAVQAALEMRHSLHLLNTARDSYNLPPLKHGVGIHTGPVLAGNSGSEEQSAYALIGDTVNVASRIQEMTKEVGCDILVSQETIDHLRGSYGTTMMAPRQVKGYSKLVIAHKVEC